MDVSEWTPGDDDGQGGLAWCDSWGLKESDMTEQLNWTELNWTELTMEVNNFSGQEQESIYQSQQGWSEDLNVNQTYDKYFLQLSKTEI